VQDLTPGPEQAACMGFSAYAQEDLHWSGGAPYVAKLLYGWCRYGRNPPTNKRCTGTADDQPNNLQRAFTGPQDPNAKKGKGHSCRPPSTVRPSGGRI
jgi:hypothetical protein